MRLKEILLYGAMFGAIYGIPRGCNSIFSDRVENTEYHHHYSEATGWLGHRDITLFYDGSADVKIYPNAGHRFDASELYQDIDGDGKVDKIRINGSEFRMNAMRASYVRQKDYFTHPDLFKKADKALKELKEKVTPFEY